MLAVAFNAFPMQGGIGRIKVPRFPSLAQATPSTPPTLPNFLENALIPYAFRSVGGVGGVISPRLARSNSTNPREHFSIVRKRTIFR